MEDDAQLVELVRRINASLDIREAAEGDCTAFEALLNRNYRRQKPSGYAHWRFSDCPFPSCLMLAIDDHRVIAGMGGHVLPLIDGRSVLFSVDLVVDQAYRNRGVPRLLEERLEEFGRRHNAVALAAFPNSLGREAHLSVPGCREVGSLQTLHQRLPANTLSESMASGHHPEFIRFARGALYARWRFDANPEYGYRTLRLPYNRLLHYKRFIDPTTGDILIDLVDMESVAKDDLQVLANDLRSMDDLSENIVLTAWAPTHTARHQVLVANGFLPEGSARSFCVRLFDPDQSDLPDFQRWDLVEADCEVF